MRKLFVGGLSVALVVGNSGCSSSPVIRSTVSKSASAGESELGFYYLPKKLIQVHLSLDDSGVPIVESGATITPALSEVVVHGKPIRISHAAKSAYSDKIKIETVDGFLHIITTDSTDERPATVAEVAESLGSLGAPKAVIGASSQEACAGRKIDELIDPLDKSNIAKFNEQNQKCGISLVPRALANSGEIGSPLGATNEGVVVPTATDYEFRLEVARGADVASTFAVFHTLIPNENSVVRLDVSRTAWVNHKTTIEFDKGLFKSVQIDRGSVTKSVAMLPIDVLKAIFSIPTTLVQFRINHATADKALIDAQKDLIEARKSLIDAQAQLDSRQAAVNTGSDDVPGDH